MSAIALCIVAYIIMTKAGGTPVKPETDAAKASLASDTSVVTTPTAKSKGGTSTPTAAGAEQKKNAATISLAVHSTRDGDLFLRTEDGQERKLGTTPGSFDLPPSDAEASLILRTTGCKDTTATVRLTKSTLIQLEPKCPTSAPQPPKQSPPPAKGTTAGPAPQTKTPPPRNEIPEEFEGF